MCATAGSRLAWVVEPRLKRAVESMTGAVAGEEEFWAEGAAKYIGGGLRSWFQTNNAVPTARTPRKKPMAKGAQGLLFVCFAIN